MLDAPVTFLDAFAVFSSGGLAPLSSGDLPGVPSTNGAVETGSERLPSVPFPSVASRLERSPTPADVPSLPRLPLPTPFGNTGFTSTITQDSEHTLVVDKYGESVALIGANLQPIASAKITGFMCDWLGITIFARSGDYRDAMAWLTPDAEKMSDWVPMGGKYGYRQGMRRGALVVYFDGADNMGCHVSLSGESCRQLEEEWNGGVAVGEPVWIDWLLAIENCDTNISRLDMAKDDFDGVLNVPVIIEKTKAGETVSMHRLWSVTRGENGKMGEKWEVSPGGDSETIYFGKRASNMFVRIYNKQKERLDKGEKGSETGHWVRFEVVFKNEKVKKFLEYLRLCRSFAVVSAWMQQTLSFREPSDTDENKVRWAVCDWWVKFFENVPKLSRSVSGRVAKTLSQSHAWLARQVAPLLSVVVDVIHAETKKLGLSGNYQVKQYLSSLVGYGRSRRKSKHMALLNESLAAVKVAPLGVELTRFRLSWGWGSAPLMSSPVVVPVASPRRVVFGSPVVGRVSGCLGLIS